MSNTAILIKHLTKIYKLYDRPIDRLKESLHPFGKKYHKPFYAINDVSFEIMRGETVGIIGKNGAGKSTLLKIITGILTPTSGSVHVHGRIASLLELGAGFNPDYTGIENIYLHGSLMGIQKEEMDTKIDDIISFADIGDYIHQSVKMYSSGMYARLAFAVAINIDADILIVDEALSVGDMKFQQKCFIQMKKFKEQNKTILLVTHDINSLRSFASHGIWIDEGKAKATGDAEQTINAYISFMAYENKKPLLNQNELNSTNQQSNTFWNEVKINEYEIHNGATLQGVRLRNRSNDTSLTAGYHCQGNEAVEYSLKVKFDKSTDQLMIGIAIVDQKGLVVSHLNTMLYDASAISIQATDEYIFTFQFTLPNLAKGYYSFYTNIVDGNYAVNDSLAMVHGVCGFEVFPAQYLYSQLNGVVYLPNSSYTAQKIT